MHRIALVIQFVFHATTKFLDDGSYVESSVLIADTTCLVLCIKHQGEGLAEKMVVGMNCCGQAGGLVPEREVGDRCFAP